MRNSEETLRMVIWPGQEKAVDQGSFDLNCYEEFPGQRMKTQMQRYCGPQVRGEYLGLKENQWA